MSHLEQSKFVREIADISYCDKCGCPVFINDRYCGRCIWSIAQGNKIKKAIYAQKESNIYNGGRPKIKNLDQDQIVKMFINGLSLRKIAYRYNLNKEKGETISHTQVSRIIESYLPKDIQLIKGELRRSKIKFHRMNVLRRNK